MVSPAGRARLSSRKAAELGVPACSRRISTPFSASRRKTCTIDGVLEQFNALWEARQCTTCRRKDVCPVPLEEPALA